MSAGTQQRDAASETDGEAQPAISICESRPGRAVFIESGNTDGWISSDLTVDVSR